MPGESVSFIEINRHKASERDSNTFVVDFWCVDHSGGILNERKVSSYLYLQTDLLLCC